MGEDRQIIGIDTTYLRADQLSRHEWKILVQIEQRLRETVSSGHTDAADCGKGSAYERREAPAPDYLARAETRHQRVLLLDGARGTGKTSFLLTLIKRWHGAAGASGETPWDLTSTQTSDLLTIAKSAVPSVQTVAAPTNIRVIRNLDFDPLPPKMPLVAGIVEAWRPLAEFYDRETFAGDELCDDDGAERLMDQWHLLFRVAAAGWSEVPLSKGLIEQVLDREEQVRDWQLFREKWLRFIDSVIRVGRCLKLPERLTLPPVFVIVIDDVDLQVERVRELLPALRLLAHNNLFFLVAAHREHLIDMLKLDFLGQQQRVAESRHASGSAIVAAEDDRWAAELAHSAFEKVFPTRNRWRLDKLTLGELLSYPTSARSLGSAAPEDVHDTIRGVLNEMRAEGKPEGTAESSRTAAEEEPSASKARATQLAGEAVSTLADAAESVFLSLSSLSYRSAQQLWQTVSGTTATETPDGKRDTRQAADVLARLVSSNADSVARVLPDDRWTVRVPTVGELAALYRPGLVDPGGDNDVVVSARPDFVYISPDKTVSAMSGGPKRFDFTAGLIASTLQELKFPVDSTGLQWEARLSLAWTDWLELAATFAWPWHTHPRPDELLAQTAKWAKYLSEIGKIAEKKQIRARHAYAWIYYEREIYFERLGAERPHGKSPLETAKDTTFQWTDLLAFIRIKSDLPEVQRDLKRWRDVTLPLLARPELGLPLDVQERLLETAFSDTAQRALKVQRRRLVTDALYVAALRRGDVLRESPSHADVEKLIEDVESRHYDQYGKPSMWSAKIERKRVRTTRAKVRSDGPVVPPRRNQR